MTEQEEKWFDGLSEQRKSFRETTFENNFDEIWDVITSPYSDQAHFVYELLQNADDCEATEVAFTLMSDKLVFKHNGKKRFTISDPDRDATRRDSERGVLGHVNAITGVRNSTKDVNSIGKFGIGFKSVFLYTETPEIYDDGMCFKIENFIVPSRLHNDFPGREKGTTVFVFPFNRRDANAPVNPADDVFHKLQRLILPTFFLRNLKRINWTYGASSGSFSKTQEELPLSKSTEDEMVASRVSLQQTLATDTIQKKTVDSFLMFSRKLPQSNLSYAVAYGMDADGNIIPVHYAPFCYFPTKIDAHLNFVINAPFLLTSDRAGISEATDVNKKQNQEMLDRLAKLVGDSIVGLRDLSETLGVRYLSDDLIAKQIIPLVEPKVAGWERLDLKKFYTEPLEVFQTKRVIPCDDGYCEKHHAYVAELMRMTEFFDDLDLQAFVKDRKARWIFKSIQFSEDKKNSEYRDAIIRPYILSITHAEKALSPIEILNVVEGRFIENRRNDIDWLKKFYRWVSRQSRQLQDESKQRYRILLDQDWRAVAVVNARREEQLFLPVEGDTTFRSVHPELHKLEEVRVLEDLFKMREPSSLDLVDKCIEKAKLGPETERDKYVRYLIKRACAGSVAIEVRKRIIEGLAKPEVGQFKTMETGRSFQAASKLFLQSERLKAILGEGSEGRFVDQNYYYDLGSQSAVEGLLKEVGISDKIHLEVETIDSDDPNFSSRLEQLKTLGYIKKLGFKSLRFSTPRCPCIESRLLFIRKKVDEGTINEPGTLAEAQLKSHQIWEALNDIVSGNLNGSEIKAVFKAKYVYKDRWAKQETTEEVSSALFELLRQVPWIWSKDGFKKARNTTTELLRDEFTSEQTYKSVCDLLDIRTVDQATIQHTIAALGEQVQLTYKMGQILRECGIKDEEDIRRAIELFRNEKSVKTSSSPIDNPSPVSSTSPDESQADAESIQTKIRRSREMTQKYKEKKLRHHPPTEQIETTQLLPSEDQDMYQPKPLDFQEKMEALLKRHQEQIDQLNTEADLQTKAVSAEEYSYAWLKTRIDLEIHANGVDDGEKREASVSFAKMEREEGTENMFILSATSDAIPQWFEEEVNQRLTIRIPGRQDIETVIESMSVMSFRLRAKVRILPGMENIDYSKIVEAKTTATRPDFLLGSLKEGVEALGYNDDYNLKDNLPEEIKFVFGPPGTGKTTYLAREEIIPLARNEKHPHVLVLTPTNKAADVLTSRIIKECGDNEDYKDWLTRFGMTLDTELQDSPVARAKDVEIVEGQSAIVVATIVRFAYDAFTTMGGMKLCDFKWDYIIFDEASMIPLMQILYPIYKCRETVKQFIIAGDPMQIAPVIMSKLSVGENIYTMVNLTDFANPTTEPRQYDVVRLAEQFRSVPCIGRIFSEFAYAGLLQHHRAAADEQFLSVQGLPDISPLTVMRYPVSRFESIFKIKLLGMSSYQIYSALFVFEYLCKLVDGLRSAGRSGFRIGVISPYRAQANIVERLVARLDKKRLEGVDIHVGTIHGFQGDECEMIIALLNPPQGMGRKEGSFINDKKVLNVAISRARDYLLLAIPDANTRNVQYLRGPLKIRELMKQTPGVFSEVETPNLEEIIWGDKDYIEKNTFSTGHQNVNVYETPEKRFEVRSEDVAIDIHFRPDRIADKHDVAFVSERERIEVEVKAEDKVRKEFVVPNGFHPPRPNERVPAMKQYFVIGQDEPKFCEDEMEDIDPSQVLAIED